MSKSIVAVLKPLE